MQRNFLKIILIFITVLLLTVTCKKYYAEEPDDEEVVDLGVGVEDASDYLWNNIGIINITLNGSTITSDSSVAVVEGSKVTINSPGTYNISGTLNDGQLIVNAVSAGTVRLIFNDINIKCTTSAPVYIKNAEKVVVVLQDNTSNIISDGASYIQNSNDEPSAAVFSKSYLSFSGKGQLTVTANFNDGISTRDGLIIKSGKISVTAPGDGIRGKDYVIVRDCNITINSGKDGLKSDNDGDSKYGYVLIEAGTFNITSKEDCIHAVTTANLGSGTFVLNAIGEASLVSSGSGYDPSLSSGISCRGKVTTNGSNFTIKATGKGGKGITSDNNITITGGTVNISTTGAAATYKNSSGTTDSYSASCISAGGDLSLISGSITASSTGVAGKGIKADGKILIGDQTNSPEINITTTGAKLIVSGSGNSANYTSGKAIKAVGAVTINNGNITISSADDGIKSETSITIDNATVSVTKSVEGMEAPLITVNSGNVSIAASDDGFNATKGLTAGGGESNDGSYLILNGGSVVVNVSGGDGLDSNGNITITGGTVAVHGPQSQPEVGMDYNGTCNVTGGLIVISGTNSNMTQAPGTGSSQYSLKIVSTSSLAASTLFHIQDAAGADLMTFKPVRSYYSVVFSSPSLKSGATYSVYTGGTSTGTSSGGIYSGGNYSGGTLKKSFTISSKVTSISI
jgi:trimeric autotransporter adhesin